MPFADDLQYVDLTDFTGGIASAHHSLASDAPMKDGLARVESTWGCYGLPGGGLAALPRMGFERDAGPPSPNIPEIWDWPTVADGYPADYDERIAVLDARVVSPVEKMPALSSAVDPDAYPSVDLFTVRQWYLVDGSNHTNIVWRFRGHPVYSGNTANTYAGRDSFLSNIDDTVTIHPTRWKYGWGSIMETRTVAGEGDGWDTIPTTQIGPPVIVAGVGGIVKIGGLEEGDPEGQDVGKYISYPDYHEGNTDDPLDPYTVLNDVVYEITQPLGVSVPAVVFGHQGRLCAVTRKSGYKVARRDYYHGNHSGFRAATEILHYWPVNGIYNRPLGPTRATFLEEATTGYGVIHSVNANSLLLVKNKGGAVQVTGDLDNPTVTRLPGIPSVGGLANRGVVTDKGFAYGTVTGVWMWTGSDTATNLAPQLDPEFWVPEDPTTPRRDQDQLRGSFAYSYPWLYAPNNWCMDMRTGGWFRYHPTPVQDPDDGTYFAYNDTDHTGSLWAVVPSYLLNERFFCQFNKDLGRSYFQWHSQPIAKSRARFLRYRSVTLVASGKGRVTVTVHGLGAPDQTVDFDLTDPDGNTDMMTGSIGVDATDVEVTITSEASDPTLPAPTVHRVSLGYFEAASVADMGAR